MSAYAIFKGACILVGFMIEAISIGYTDKWFALPMVAAGFALFALGINL